ncbi:hypothetical protein GCM10010216_01540 [Streptomyces flaveolus]|nr:hypothetical protein GCM10010216_01540 [Streptomyces flaveolus]
MRDDGAGDPAGVRVGRGRGREEGEQGGGGKGEECGSLAAHVGDSCSSYRTPIVLSDGNVESNPLRVNGPRSDRNQRPENTVGHG